MSENFNVGDLVWARMKGYPPWPARILQPSTSIKPPKGKKSHFVFFFGSENHAWIQDKDISPHSESFLENLKNRKKTGAYQNAIEALINYSKSNRKEKLPSPKVKKEKSEIKSNECKKKIVKVFDFPIKKHERKVMVHKPFKKKLYEKREHIESSSNKSQTHEVRDFPPVGSIFPNVSNSSSVPHFRQWNGSGQLFFNKYRSFDCDSTSSHLKKKQVLPSLKKIGFIGLGHIGRAVIKNLLDSGHNVTVWNRTSHKCDPFRRIGAKIAESAEQLVVECDITFCCVSDPEASKSIIFGDKGILKGLELADKMGLRNRGYVEMTLMDPQTSEEIGEAVVMKNGKYLEAPVCGTSENAQEGTLLVLAAGDRKLFLDCETCFHAMGKHAYYVSCDIGYGTKMAVILSSVSGAVYAALAEAMVLIERLGLPKQAFIDILRLGPLRCDGIVDKAEKMELRDFRPVTPLKHMQKDLNLSMLMANDYSQPMPVTSAANELFKHSRLLKHDDLDVSAVYKGVKF